MKRYRAFYLLLLAGMLSACANSSFSRSGQRDAGFQAPRPPVSAGKAPTEISTDLSSGASSADKKASEDVKKPSLPAISAKPSYGLMTPPAAQKPEPDLLPGTDKQKVVLNFEKADVAEVTNQIFGDYLKLNYVLDPGLQGRLSFYLEGEFSREELYQMILKAYEANGISITNRKGIYSIQPLQKGSSSSLPLATKVLLQDEKAGARPVIVIYRLQFMEAKQALNIIKTFLTPGRPATSDSLTNTLVFVEDVENARSILEVLKAMDINILREVSMEIVPVQGMSPVDAAQGMEALIGKMNLFKESTVKTNVAFIPLPNFGGVLVLAQNPEVLRTAKSWLTALDLQGKETGEQVHVYFVQNGLAGDIGDILNQVFGLGGGISGRRLQQQVVRSSRQFGGTGQSFGSTGGISGSSFGTSSGTGTFGSTGGFSSTSRAFGSSSTTQSGDLSGSATGSGGTSSFGAGARRARIPGAGGAGPGQPNILSGEVVIIPDEVNNAIVIRANANDYAKIRKTIESLDILPRAVLIEVMIAEVTLNKELQYGLQWFFQDIGIDIGGREGKFTIGKVNPGSGTSTGNDSLNDGTGKTQKRNYLDLTPSATGGLSTFWGTLPHKGVREIAVLLDLLAAKTTVNVLSTPTLLATDNQQASITVGGREPIQTGQTLLEGGTTANNIFTTVQYEETGIILNVIPHINAGGLVRLEVEQIIRNVADQTTQGINSPRFTERNVRTTLLAQDGSTVVIGGIIEDRHTNGKTGIPVLQDIPIIWPLFSTLEKKMNRTELIIAITPHVVDHRESDVTREFLSKLKQLKRRIEN